jgi:UDP-2,4-diacetamido-2,4,6-trideoxy-beta-L-altropyranose hydrolase
MSDAPLLVIRADGNATIGTGHVMRCLALAQTWQDAGGQVIFALARGAPALEERLKREAMTLSPISAPPGSIADAKQTNHLALRAGARWLVVDGYHFSSSYQQWVKQFGMNLLVIDDNGQIGRSYADIVVNQNLHAHEDLYRERESYTRLLLGTDYALLRREFLRWRDWKRTVPETARNVLVTLGGSDPGNVTLAVIRGLAQLQRLELNIKIAVGSANGHGEALRRELEDGSRPMELVTRVDDMPALMAWADLAISGGGSTCWELAFMGLPHCIIVIAENQCEVAGILEQRGTSVSLGRSMDLSALVETVERLLQNRERRLEMSSRGRRMVSGNGSRLVAQAILDQVEEK